MHFLCFVLMGFSNCYPDLLSVCDAGEVNQDLEWSFEFAVLSNEGVDFNKSKVGKICLLVWLRTEFRVKKCS